MRFSFRLLMLALLALSLVCTGSAGAIVIPGAENSDPKAVRIVTDDIPNFWRAFEAAKHSDPNKAYAYDYFAPGTPGLWGFVPGRLVSPSRMVKVVAKYQRYYEAARPYMLQIPAQRQAIIEDFERFKAVYPKAVFPDLYFVVGGLNSGGTSVNGVGLVMGAEMVSVPPNVDSIAMPGVDKLLLHSVDRIPALASHELTHFNQHDADQNTLLDSTLHEGAADFIAQLVDGNNIDKRQWEFGCAHEDELWKAFQAQMDSGDDKVVTQWLFSTDPGPLDAPPFIGYWLGSRIVQTYYDASPNKANAIDAMFHMTSFKKFLAESGYPDHKPACSPEKRVS